MLSLFSCLSAFIYLTSTLVKCSINNAFALVALIERFKLFPFIVCHTSVIVQAEASG